MPPTLCAACQARLCSPATDLLCYFATTGFPFTTGSPARPCRTAYCRPCFQAGPPFNCRRRSRSGLRFPPKIQWPLFICEACTVRAVLSRELGQSSDRTLLQLERVRILDVANSWALSTYRAYRSKLRFLTFFESHHPGLSLLPRFTPTAPPANPSIAVAWAELSYSLRPGRRADTVSYNTVRQLRSAVGWFHMAGLLTSQGRDLYFDEKQRRLTQGPTCIPQEAGLRQFTLGLKNRLGTTTTPSKALLDRHVRSLDQVFAHRFHAATSDADRLHWATAACANLFLWLGWLRSRELFDLRWRDVLLVDPADGPSKDLPPGTGALILSLNAQTKTHRSSTATVPIAYRTISGLEPGRWFHRLQTLAAPHLTSLDEHIFVHPTGGVWDSFYFRHTFLYPHLTALRDAGDAYLRDLPGPASHAIPLAFWSLHCYRRGGRSHSEILRSDSTFGRRRSTRAERYEHARWRMNTASEEVDVLYREWHLLERLAITTFCM